MEIEFIGTEKLLTVRPQGEIDHRSVTEIRERIERKLYTTGAVNIAFDFTNVNFMDSSGIGMLIGRYKTVNALGGKIIIYGISRELFKIIRMSGLDKLIEMY